MKELNSGNTLTIDIDAAKMLAELYNSAKIADAHFKTCQSAQFRQYMKGVFKAPNVQNAFQHLNEMIKSGGV